jgi:hypothetical protein
MAKMLLAEYDDVIKALSSDGLAFPRIHFAKAIERVRPWP